MKFVQYRLKKQCTPAHKEYCTVDEEINLARYVTMDEEEIEIAMEKIEEKIQNIGADFGGKMWTIQNQYDTAIRVKEKHIRGMMKGSYGTMKAVRDFREKKGEDMSVGMALPAPVETAAVGADGSVTVEAAAE